MMKRFIQIGLLSLLLIPGSLWAQIQTSDVQLKMDEAKARLEDFNTEHKIDSLD